MTNELSSGVDEYSYDYRHAIIRYNEEEALSKDFTFKVGMEFSSLENFKKDILEHNVLNGREVTFSKNDATRYRVVRKDKKLCNYIVMCNKVLRSITYKINNLFHKHKCGRYFFKKKPRLIGWLR